MFSVFYCFAEATLIGGFCVSISYGYRKLFSIIFLSDC